MEQAKTKDEVKEPVKIEVQEVKKEKSCKFNNFYKFLIVLTFLLIIVILFFTLFQIKEGERGAGKILKIGGSNWIDSSYNVIDYKCSDNVIVNDFRSLPDSEVFFRLYDGEGVCLVLFKQKYHYLAWK